MKEYTIKEKKEAGKNLVVITEDGRHHVFNRRGANLQLTENKFFFTVRVDCSDEDIINAIRYCNS